MKPSGLLLAVIGVWVLSQVLAGNALKRLGVVDGEKSSGSSSSTPPPADGYGPGYRDGNGRPL